MARLTKSEIAMKRLAELELKKQKAAEARRAEDAEIAKLMREARVAANRAAKDEYKASVAALGAEIAERVGAETADEINAIKERLLLDDVVKVLTHVVSKVREPEPAAEADTGGNEVGEEEPQQDAQTEPHYEAQHAPQHEAPTYGSQSYYGG